jgi:hypothetical protein
MVKVLSMLERFAFAREALSKGEAWSWAGRDEADLIELA